MTEIREYYGSIKVIKCVCVRVSSDPSSQPIRAGLHGGDGGVRNRKHEVHAERRSDGQG